MFMQTSHRVCKKLELAPTEFEAIAEDSTDTVTEEQGLIDVAIPSPAVCEIVLFAKFDIHEVVGQGGVMVLVVLNDAVRLGGIRLLGENACGSNDNRMTQKVPVWSLESYDGLNWMFAANKCGTSARRFTDVTHSK